MAVSYILQECETRDSTNEGTLPTKMFIKIPISGDSGEGGVCVFQEFTQKQVYRTATQSNKKGNSSIPKTNKLNLLNVCTNANNERKSGLKWQLNGFRLQCSIKLQMWTHFPTKLYIQIPTFLWKILNTSVKPHHHRGKMTAPTLAPALLPAWAWTAVEAFF